MDILELSIFLKDFAKLIDYHLEKFNMTYQSFVQSNFPENKKLHDIIINFISNRFKTVYDCKEFCNNDDVCKAIFTFTSSQDAKNIILLYLNEFIDNKFLRFKNGKIIDDDFLFINPDGDSRYFKDKYSQNKNKNLPCFILPDGTCYFSPKSHAGLARWLHVNGIDISHALRFEQFGEYNEVSIGESNDYNRFSLNKSELPSVMIVTDDQAQTFAKMYKTINQFKKLEPIEEVLLKAYGLHLHKSKTPIGRKNLSVFENAFGSNYIDLSYIQSHSM